MTEITPKLLDALCNGVLVRFYKSPVTGIYATVYDFSQFGAKEIDAIRIPIAEVTRDWNPDTCPKVRARLDKLKREA